MFGQPELLGEAEEAYMADASLRQIATESARTEAAGYCKATRVEEIMDFARRMGWHRLGIAHCAGLMREADAARDIFMAGGFEVWTVCCKVGSIDKEDIGIRDEEKVRPGEYEVMCNPVGQAAVLAQAGTQFNVVIGLCVGHDSMFFAHSKAPVTVLVVKDRVLGHNPVAALYTTHSYYKRLTERDASPEAPRHPAAKAKELNLRPSRPSLEAWLDEIKSSPDSSRIGMYLVHNGVVRGSARDGSAVSGMDLSYDRERLRGVKEQIQARSGVVAVRVWINEGALVVGDDIMYALVAGDIRENVLSALQELVRLIKSEVVAEREIS